MASRVGGKAWLTEVLRWPISCSLAPLWAGNEQACYSMCTVVAVFSCKSLFFWLSEIVLVKTDIKKVKAMCWLKGVVQYPY